MGRENCHHKVICLVCFVCFEVQWLVSNYCAKEERQWSSLWPFSVWPLTAKQGPPCWHWTLLLNTTLRNVVVHEVANLLLSLSNCRTSVDSAIAKFPLIQLWWHVWGISEAFSSSALCRLVVYSSSKLHLEIKWHARLFLSSMDQIWSN